MLVLVVVGKPSDVVKVLGKTGPGDSDAVPWYFE
jgi:hypothetical protein